MGQKVFENVYLVGSSSLTDPADCNVYLLDLGELVLIDTGCGRSTQKIIKNIEGLALMPDRISTIVITHCHIDHVGGAKYFKERFGSKIVMHALDATFVKEGDPIVTGARWYGIDFEGVSVDLEFREKEKILNFDSFNLHLLHTPGHTPGSIASWIDINGRRILFGQDIHGPFLPEFGADMENWRDSMRLLLALKADVLCEGHFGIYEPASEVRRYIEGYLNYYGFTP